MKLATHLFLPLIFLFAMTSVLGQDIQLYHGLSKTSTIINERVGIKKIGRFKFYQGEKITVSVINAHPGLYEYKFIEKEIEIEEPTLPDLSKLVASLSGELNLKTENAEKARASIVRSFGNGQWPDLYKQKIADFKSWISDAESIIKQSDMPQSIDKSLDLYTDGGFIWAQKELADSDLFNKISDVDTFVSSWQKEVKSPNAPYYYQPDSRRPEIELLMELYDNYMKTLSIRAKEIRNSYHSSVSSIVSKSIIVSDKKARLNLLVKAKNEKLNKREIGDSLISIEIIPYYNRPIVELVPVAIVSRTNNRRVYGISDGIITVSERNEFQFGTGVSLNINFLNWGPRKEISLGGGLGFAYVNEELDNFFLNTSLNYGKWVRLGIGYGWLNTPTGLKGELVPGSDASNISNINEVIELSREPALFFTIVIPGLNLPIKK